MQAAASLAILQDGGVQSCYSCQPSASDAFCACSVAMQVQQSNDTDALLWLCIQTHIHPDQQLSPLEALAPSAIFSASLAVLLCSSSPALTPAPFDSWCIELNPKP